MTALQLKVKKMINERVEREKTELQARLNETEKEKQDIDMKRKSEITELQGNIEALKIKDLSI